MTHLAIQPNPMIMQDYRSGSRVFWESLPLRINTILHDSKNHKNPENNKFFDKTVTENQFWVLFKKLNPIFIPQMILKYIGL